MLGEELADAEIGLNGIPGDRAFMLIDKNRRFLTQRELPQMALFNSSLKDGNLNITYRPTGESISISLTHSDLISAHVSIWQREHKALVFSKEANEWLSDLLIRNVELVGINTEHGYPRKVKGKKYSININFPDGYPLLIAGSKSLEDLNNKLSEPVGWDRFRPNIVIVTKEAFEEDNWDAFTADPQDIQIVKSCPRCKIVATDQLKGVLTKEPLATLSKYRKKGNSVTFGVYGFVTQKTALSTNQSIIVKQKGPTN